MSQATTTDAPTDQDGPALRVMTCTVKLRGTAPLSFSKPITTKKPTGESHDAFEERTWREKMHVENGEVFIPNTAMKNSLAETAQFLSESVPGKGKATYTKHFKAGIMVVKPLMLGIKAADVESERVFVPSDGKPGGGNRVWKHFPTISPGWTTEAEIIVLDPLLVDKPDLIKRYLIHDGQFIGFLRFRPIRGGYYGRFEVTDFSHVEALPS